MSLELTNFIRQNTGITVDEIDRFIDSEVILVRQQLNNNRQVLKKVASVVRELIVYTNECVTNLNGKVSDLKEKLLTTNREYTELNQRLLDMYREIGDLNVKMAGLRAEVSTIQEDIASIDNTVASERQQCGKIVKTRWGLFPFHATIQGIIDKEPVGTILLNSIPGVSQVKAIHSFTTNEFGCQVARINELNNQKDRLDGNLNSTKKTIKNKEEEKSSIEREKEEKESEKQCKDSQVKAYGIELTRLQNVSKSLNEICVKFHFISEDVQLHDAHFRDIKYEKDEVRWLLQEANKIRQQFIPLIAT